MTGLALLLVLSAAFVHASWNFLTKRAGGGTSFLWLFSLLSSIIYLPVAIFALIQHHSRIGMVELGFIIGSAALHLGYFMMLQRGYRVGDLSVIYPLARGIGPTLSTAAAILLFGEQPTLFAMIGAGFVIFGVFILTGGTSLFKTGNIRKSLIFGSITGSLIAGYTVWDKHAVSALFIPPLFLEYCSMLVRIMILSPYAFRHWEDIRSVWNERRKEAIGVACLNPLSYLLVLFAMIFTPVSYVAPAREVSVLIAVLMGTGLLKEGEVVRRLVSGILILIGVVTLTLN
jgi:drug/metabolite transporter (DMT)-like permease